MTILMRMKMGQAAVSNIESSDISNPQSLAKRAREKYSFFIFYETVTYKDSYKQNWYQKFKTI